MPPPFENLIQKSHTHILWYEWTWLLQEERKPRLQATTYGHVSIVCVCVSCAVMNQPSESWAQHPKEVDLSSCWKSTSTLHLSHIYVGLSYAMLRCSLAALPLGRLLVWTHSELESKRWETYEREYKMYISNVLRFGWTCGAQIH